VSEPVLTVEGVTREYRNRGVTTRVLDDVSVSLLAGRTLAVVGESGAGKTTLARLICGLDRPTAGTVRVAGRDPAPRRGAPSPVQLVFQNPADALNPFLTVGRSIGEPLRALPRAERQAHVAELLQRVGIDPERAGQRPAAFSGGQLQRIVLARALAARPQLLVCDEPTSALDVSVQAQIVNLLLELQAALGFACVLVTHDLAVVRVLADDLLVLRHGRMVEAGLADRFFAGPTEPYSKSLLEAVAQQALSRHEWFARQPAMEEQ
jgi:ABC-type glutathione transport system ATPase component